MSAIRRRVEGWFMAPEADAAGRMGVFRILYGLFYLWHVSMFDLSLLAGEPPSYRAQEVPIVSALGAELTATQLRLVDSLLVGVLVLLLLGFHTRLATGVVLVVGVYRELLLLGPEIEDAIPILVFWLPFLMLVVGRWGETHSFDAAIRRRRGTPASASGDDSWTYFVAARAMLVVLAALFLSAALTKSIGAGTWIRHHEVLTNLMLQKNVDVVLLRLPSNPIAPWIDDHRRFGYLLQLSVLVVEGTFFLALVTRELRRFYVAVVLVFHALNALFLAVTFTTVLIAYGLFVNWEALLRRLRPKSAPVLRLSSRTLTTVALVIAAALALSWRAGSHSILELGGALDRRTIWFPILPLALFELGRLAAAVCARGGQLVGWRP